MPKQGETPKLYIYIITYILTKINFLMPKFLKKIHDIQAFYHLLDFEVF